MHIRPRTTIGAALAALAIIAAACGERRRRRTAPTARQPPAAGQHRPPASADSTASTEAAGGDSGAVAGGSVYDVDLTGICPDPLVIQTDWFPEPDHGYTYQAIGTEARSTPRRARTPGRSPTPGITLEIRAGGPFINFSPPAQQIYADPTIFAGYADTGDVIRNAGGEQPLVSVFASYDKGPQILMWDPARIPTMQTIEDVKESGATVLYFEGAAYMDYLLETGQLDRRPDRRLLRRQPRALRGRGQPRAAGLRHQRDLQVRERHRRVDEASGVPADPRHRLRHLPVGPVGEARDADREQGLPRRTRADLPAGAGGLRKDPDADEREARGDRHGAGHVLDADGGRNADAVQRMLDLELVSDAGNTTIGDFDCERVDGLIEKLAPGVRGEGRHASPPTRRAMQVVTNEFIDTSISLGQ